MLIHSAFEESESWGAPKTCPPLLASVGKAIEDFGGIQLEEYATIEFPSAVDNALEKQFKGHFSAAERHLQEALELSRHAMFVDRSVIVALECHLSKALTMQHKYKDAEEVLDGVLRKQVATFGLRHPSTLSTRSRLADIYLVSGRLSAARGMYSEVLQGLTALCGEGRHEAQVRCAQVRRKLWDVDEAERKTAARLV